MRLLSISILCASFLVVAAAGSSARLSTAELTKQVADTERAFAATMKARDHAAFTRFVSDEAVFFAGSAPLRGKPSRQPSRTAGRAMRNGECTMAGIACSMGDGAGSWANGSQPTTRPSSTRALKAPQWASEGKRSSVIQPAVGHGLT